MVCCIGLLLGFQHRLMNTTLIQNCFCRFVGWTLRSPGTTFGLSGLPKRSIRSDSQRKTTEELNSTMLGIQRVILRSGVMNRSWRPMAPLAPLKISFSLSQSSAQQSRHLQPFATQHHHFSCSSLRCTRRSYGPPRFNRGPSNGIFTMVPDSVKTAFAVIGGCAFLMVFGPLFFMIVPPLFLGGFFMTRYVLRRRSNGMNDRWALLKTSQLKFKGSELDTENLEKWIKERVTVAFEKNEKDIVKVMGIDTTRSHHTLSSRLELEGPESVDQDIRMRDRIDLSQRITVITYGLVDIDSRRRVNKIGTVTVSLQPDDIRDLLDITSITQRAIIEVKPLLKFRGPVILNTEDSSTNSSFINIRAKRTKTI